MTRRDQRAFDVQNNVGRARKDANGNFLMDDGRTAINTNELKGLKPGRRNDKGLFLDADNKPIADGESSALASDYPYPV